jgi:mannosyltransferase
MAVTQSVPFVTAELEGAAEDGARWRDRLVLAVPALITLATTTWGISGASYWRDEAATVSAVSRPLPAMLSMLTHVDAVHGAYYLLMWPLARLAGTGEVAMRLPSALAMSLTAALIAAIGRRAVSARAGLAAGTIWAVLPVTSWYGQDARSYALVTTLACAASYLFLRRSSSWYGVSLVALGLVNVFGLLLIPAHAVTLAATDRAGLARWRATAITAAAVTMPLVVLVWRQRADVAWIPALDQHEFDTVTGWAGSLAVSELALLILLIGAAFAAAGKGAGRSAAFPRDFVALCLPWLLLPLAALLAVSVVKPIFEFRYVLFSLPAMALLLGAAVAALGRVTAALTVAALALIALPAQQAVRAAEGHYENIREIDHVIAANEHPGDAVLYPWDGWRQAAAAYPYGLTTLADLSLDQTPVQADNLLGSDLQPGRQAARLRQHDRVWILAQSENQSGPLFSDNKAFQLARTWHIADAWLELYVRSGPDHPERAGRGRVRSDNPRRLQGRVVRGASR